MLFSEGAGLDALVEYLVILFSEGAGAKETLQQGDLSLIRFQHDLGLLLCLIFCMTYSKEFSEFTS